MSAASSRVPLLAALLALTGLGTALPLRAQVPKAAMAEEAAPMGATVQGQGAARHVVFRIWAPNASTVKVSGDFNGWKEEPMQKEASRPGHWVLDSRQARPGDAYRFAIDGLQRRDPRARAVHMAENKSYVLDPRA